MIRHTNLGGRFVCAGAVLLATAFAGGCASSQPAPRAATALPSPDEMPPPQRSERIGSASVAVEGRGGIPRLATVPRFEPVEPTPEEREILGPPPADPLEELLVFYPIPPGTQQGVHPVGAIPTHARDGLRVVPRSTVGSARAGTSAVDVTARPAQGVLLRPGAASAVAGTRRSASGQPYPEEAASVGEGEARTEAGRRTRYED